MTPSQGYIVAVTKIIPLLLVPLSLLIITLSRRRKIVLTQVPAFLVGWLSLLAVVYNFVRPGGVTILQILYSKDVFSLFPFYLGLAISFLSYLVAGIFGLVWRARKDTGKVTTNWVREGIFALVLYFLYLQFGLSIALGVGLLATALFLEEWWSAAIATFVVLLLALGEIAPSIAELDPFTTSRYLGFFTFSGGFTVLVAQLVTIATSQQTSPQEAEAPRESIPSPSELSYSGTEEREVSSKTILLTFLGLGTMISTVAVLIEANLIITRNQLINCIVIRTAFLLVALPVFYAVVSLLGVPSVKRGNITLVGTMIWFALFLTLGILNTL
jgi:hypothetical protein